MAQKSTNGNWTSFILRMRRNPLNGFFCRVSIRAPFLLVILCVFSLACVSNSPRISDVQRDFADVSNRIETYHQSQEKAMERQQKTLLQIQEMIDKESREITFSHDKLPFSSPARPESAPSVSRLPSSASPASSSAVSNDAIAKRLFEKAIDQYNRKQYASAAEAFLLAFARANTDEMKARCLYWTGECHYQNQQWDKALTCFIQTVTRFPQHPIVPSAILKAGYTHINSGRIAEGKKVLRGLVEAYPQSNEAGQARERLQELGVPL